MALNQEKFTEEGLTYDDVLLLPAYSEVLPREVELNTFFTSGIRMNIPIVSAAMDTVTEHKLAIAIAQEGGIGVLHKNMSIEKQANEVKKVKRAENGMILDPITLDKSAKVRDALAIMKEYGIGGIPVVDRGNRLVGIVTNRDLRFERNPERPVTEIMTYKNLITTTEFTDFEKAADQLQEFKIEKLPVENDSVDVIISNCVINLSPEKQKVFQEAFRVLKPSGRLMVSDLVLVKDLPKAIKESIEAYVGCLAGAIRKTEYLKLMKAAGFQDVEVINESNYPVDAMFDNLKGAEDAIASIKVSAKKPAAKGA